MAIRKGKSQRDFEKTGLNNVLPLQAGMGSVLRLPPYN